MTWLSANWHWVVTVLMAALFVVSAIGNLVMDEMEGRGKMTAWQGRVFANTDDEAHCKVQSLHPSATRITIRQVALLPQGIWFEYCALRERSDDE